MNSFSGSEVQQSINEQCDSDFPLRELTKVIGEARRRKLIRRKERWHFVVEDFDAPNFIVNDDIDAGAHVISLQALMCPGQVISPSYSMSPMVHQRSNLGYPFVREKTYSKCEPILLMTLI